VGPSRSHSGGILWCLPNIGVAFARENTGAAQSLDIPSSAVNTVWSLLFYAGLPLSTSVIVVYLWLPETLGNS